MNHSRTQDPLRSGIPEGLDDMRVVVQAVISDREEYKRVLEARGHEAQQCLDALHALLGLPDIENKLRTSILKLILRLSKRSNLCPKCLNINNVERISERPIDGGGFGDVWKGKVGSQFVCLKVVKVYLVSDVQKLLKEYMREAIVWEQLHHPNLLPFMGMYYLDEAREPLCLVSPWMDRGNLVRYLKNTPSERADHQVLVYDVASGLAYLHSLNIIHGDLKGVNVLMTPDERACITDFGLSRVADTHSLYLSSSTMGQGGTTRWSAPELLQSNPPSSVTMKSDTYAYAGNVPFHGLAEPAVMFAVVINKQHPERPSGVRELTDDMWGIMIKCWNHDAQERPEAEDVRSDVPSEWDGLSVAEAWKHVEYPSVDVSAVVRFLKKGLPLGSLPVDDRTYPAEDAPDTVEAHQSYHTPSTPYNLSLVLAPCSPISPGPSIASLDDDYITTVIPPEGSPFHDQPQYTPSTLHNQSPVSDVGCPTIKPFAFLTVPSYDNQSSQSFNFDMVLSQNQPEPPTGTAPGFHASSLEPRVRPTIRTQFSPAQYPSPYLSSGSTPSSLASLFPFTQTPSNAGTGSAFHTKPLPSDDYGHATTIDLTLLQPTLDADRGRSLDVHTLGHRRSRSAVNGEWSHTRVSHHSSRLGPQPRPVRHRQRSRERSPLPLEVNGSTVDTPQVQMELSILFDTDPEPFDPGPFLDEGALDNPRWDHGDRSQSFDDDTTASASIHQGQNVNGKRHRSGDEAEQQPGYLPAVTSDGVVRASKSRRTTTGPR
ncbi:Rho guanine nucleotide exchange factor [Marasmius tenuissimus]|uniref:Rho guanine nucleotide exchange factor n=1 Tax=Marasmius tenuissimus TaxID=585030 RepID=A0ABR3A158_9AGAR